MNSPVFYKKINIQFNILEIGIDSSTNIFNNIRLEKSCKVNFVFTTLVILSKCLSICRRWGYIRICVGNIRTVYETSFEGRSIIILQLVLFQWFAILISVNNLLQIINCTVNYIIYFGHCWKWKRSRNSGAGM